VGGAVVCRSFDFVVGGFVCGENLTATLHVQDGATDLGNVTWVLPTGTPAVAFAQAFDNVTPPALPTG
jgi:hypothetical protein